MQAQLDRIEQQLAALCTALAAREQREAQQPRIDAMAAQGLAVLEQLAAAKAELAKLKDEPAG